MKYEKSLYFGLKGFLDMTEKELNPSDKTPFAAVMPRSSSFILLSAEMHSQRFSENDCPVENMTYEQLLQLQYLPHKPIIRQPVCTYSVPKTFKSSCREYHSENPTRIHDGAQEKNGKTDSYEFGQIDTEEINRVEQSISKIEKRCCDADKLLTGHASSETNGGITSTQNTENYPKIFERDFYVLRESTEILTNATDKFVEKQFKAEKQSDEEDDHNDNEESNETAIKPNILFQEKMDRNEKVTNFLKGLPEMASNSCNFQSESCEKDKATTSEDPEDIHPVRSTSGDLDYEEDFESFSNDTNDESGVCQFLSIE